MKNIIALRRLFIEILAAVFATEAAVMFLLPIFEGVGETAKTFIDAGILSALVGPILLWRCKAAIRRSSEERVFLEVRRCRVALIGGVFLAGFALSMATAYVVRKDIEHDAQGRFAHQTSLTTIDVERSLKQTVYGLKGLRGLYAGSKSVERLEFRKFVDSRKMSTEFPGVCGFGFIQRVKRPDLEKFIAAERADDAPDFSVKTEGSASDLYVLKFMENLVSNRMVWGQDLGEHPVLRAEIQSAIASGKPTLTTEIPICHDNTQNKGLVFLLAVYRNGTDPKTPEERLAALEGVLYAPLTLQEAFAGLKKSTEGQVSFEFYAGTERKSSDLVWDSDGDAPSMTSDLALDPKHHPLFHEFRTFELGGKTWTLGTHSTPVFEATIYYFIPPLVGAIGLTLTLLFTAFVMSLSDERSRALLLAKRMTKDLEVAKDQAESALRDNQALIHTLDLHSLVSSTDASGKIIYVNDAVCKGSGYTREELMGQNHRLLKSGVQPADFWSNVWKQISSGKTWQGEVCNKAKDGSLYWVSSIITPFLDSEGNIEKYLSIRTDITANKLAEAKLQKLIEELHEQTRINKIAQRDNDALIRTLDQHSIVSFADPAGNITYVNDAFCKISGYTREEVLGHNHRLVKSGLQDKDFWPNVWKQISSGKTWQGEICNRAKDGSLYWVRSIITPFLDSEGKIEKYLSIRTDITEIKQTEIELNKLVSDLKKQTAVAEAALRDNEALIKTLDLHALISFADPAGSITYVNDAFCKISGYTREELLGQNHRLVKSGFHDNDFWPTAWAQISSGQPWQGEVCNKAKDGSLYWVNATVTPFVNSEGTIEKYLSIRTDITASKLTEIQLKALVRNLKEQTLIAQQFAIKAGEASAAKSEFLANVSHEIRTPMNGVLGMTELLLQSNLNENQQQIAQTVRRSGEILLTLINDVLDFSKIEAGKLTLEDIDFDLNVLLDELSEVLAIRAQEKGLDIVCVIAPKVPLFLRGDPGRLRQILTNLVGNAIKFSQEGVIFISVTIVKDSNEDILLRFSVKDSGIGIPADKIDKLFQSFSQVDGSLTRKRDGTGLGLAISKQLAHLMHGEIGVESENGKGSEFWFTAHLKRQPKQPQFSIDDVVRGKSILIIDTHPLIREALRVQLTAGGLLPAEAASSPEALHALNKACDEGKLFDLILLDTPLLGSDLLGRKIRKDVRLSKIPLILMIPLSGQARGDTQRFESLEYSALLTKPVRKENLFKCIVESLSSTENNETSVKFHHVRRPSSILNAISESTEQHTERILVAEDNKINQQVALGMLKMLGYPVDIANNGNEALEALASRDYALVFMDMMMPEMDGLTATQEIRNEKSAVRNHQIPIIAMTANIASGDRAKCVEAGMDDYISKPISIAVLEKTIKKWLAITPETEPVEVAKTASSAKSGVALKSLGDIPIFDRAGMIVNLGEDLELARTLAQMFIKDTPDQIQQLTEHLAKQDMRLCEIQVHAIKGAAATMGGEAMRAIAYEMELTAKSGDLTTFAVRLPELSVQFEILKKVLVDFAAE